MIKIENLEVFNLEGAIRGMRFPKKSNHLSDSFVREPLLYIGMSVIAYYGGNSREIGPKDLDLAIRLIRAGSDHSKFLRQIMVSMDITAPLYWWKEMDTYKVATVANSESTMHKLASTPITRECFSFDSMSHDTFSPSTLITGNITVDDWFDEALEHCEMLRRSFIETGDKRYWRALIQLLPSGWNQKRHWTGNYANLLNMAVSREGHKLDEWKMFIEYLTEEAPYFKIFLAAARERK